MIRGLWTGCDDDNIGETHPAPKITTRSLSVPVSVRVSEKKNSVLRTSFGPVKLLGGDGSPSSVPEACRAVIPDRGPRERREGLHAGVAAVGHVVRSVKLRIP